MKALTPHQVLFLHADLIRKTGGEPGLRDLGLLLSALARPQATFEGRDLYPDVFDKAAALMHSLIQNHAFVDGNKRVGIAVAGIFLGNNGYDLKVNKSVMVSFVVSVARGEQGTETIGEWLRKYSKKIG